MRILLALIQKYFVVMCFLMASGAAVSVRAQMNAVERIETFEEVWQKINDYYYDANFNGVNWLQVKKIYRARLEKTSDEKSFYALLDRMAGELRDSHTRVFSPEQRLQRRKRQTASVGIHIKKIENSFVIAAVASDSEADRAGIKPGMRILSINHQPVKEAVAAARQKTGASSSKLATEMRVFSKLLNGEPETEMSIELENSIGKKVIYKLKRGIVSMEPRIVRQKLDSGIVYLKITDFEESVEKQFEAALEESKDAPALILDLRDNNGGDGEVGLRIAGHFVKDRISIAKLITRSGKPPIAEMPLTLEIGGKNSPVYIGPMVILVNERTTSTSELISNALQEQKRAVIIGSNSCGCVLGFLDYKKLKSGGDLTMSEFGFVTANGKTLEGNGVKPDKVVKLTIKNIQNNRDAALFEAENYLLNLH